MRRISEKISKIVNPSKDMRAVLCRNPRVVTVSILCHLHRVCVRTDVRLVDEDCANAMLPENANLHCDTDKIRSWPFSLVNSGGRGFLHRCKWSKDRCCIREEALRTLVSDDLEALAAKTVGTRIEGRQQQPGRLATHVARPDARTPTDAVGMRGMYGG